MMIPSLYLKPSREKAIERRHPWIFSGAVERVDEGVKAGETVAVRSTGGDWLAWAAYSPQSNIRARIWGYEESEAVGAQMFTRRLRVAIERRLRLGISARTDAYRLVHGESDGIPGLIVDRYADVLVAQFLSAGVEYWKQSICHILIELTGCQNVYERSDLDIRKLEGLPEWAGVLYGKEPEQPILIEENGLKFYVDIQSGQKTGFYLDQRFNRQWLRMRAMDCSVLNCFCYTGGFSVYALAGGASSVLSVDSAAEALRLADENIKLNGFSGCDISMVEADVFHYLRDLRDRNRKFDIIILDPPKFAPTAAQAERAARGYKDINLLAFKLLNPGGLLFTFSCSGGISADFFQKVVMGAALDAGVNANIVTRFAQDCDHPVSLYFPEGSYLKGFEIQNSLL